ncbi:MAG: glycosyltransferase family 2 protein [Candidatus Pacearchaeota archaeon]
MIQYLKMKVKKRVKLIVQIPAYNEEANIGRVIKEIPKQIDGIDEIKILVIDDGSTDRTIEEAKKAGADYVIKNTKNSGLAYSFQRGMETCLSLGADIIVNTDADFQYNQEEIPKLIEPLLRGEADIVSGNRQVEKLNHMVPAKKYGNILGSKVVKMAAGYHIHDASSGFRAYNKLAAMKLFVTSKHTYTHETLIQASRKNLKVVEVPVEFRKRNGDSKLIKSVYSHIKKSMATISRATLMYNSLKFFSYIGSFLIFLGLILIGRWFTLSYIIGDGGDHLQSIIIGSLLIMWGGMSLLLGLISDIIAINRQYLEEILYRIKRHDYESNGKGNNILGNGA